MQPQSNILDKIRKLLRLADRSRGATENEAKVALAKAQELMTRHNIDSVLFRMEHGESGSPSFKVDKGKVDLPKTLNPADLQILSILQKHFNVRCILTHTKNATPVDIIGAPADIDVAIYAFNFLRTTFFRCWNEFKAGIPGADRKAYYKGLHDGICEVLNEAKKRAEESYASNHRDAYALVVVDQKAAVAHYVDTNYGKLRTKTSRATRMNSSYFAGAAKGRTIQVNQPLSC
jgi:hypothetical protein